MSQPKRRPAGSRPVTSRPRKIAGRVDVPLDEGDQVERVAAPRKQLTSAQPKPPRQPQEPGGFLVLFAGGRLTRVLMVALGVLALVVAGQCAWFAVHKDRAPHVPTGQIAVPSGRPVILNQTDVDAGVDQAAKDAATAVSLHWQHFDDDVAKAADLMTSDFATKFKQTTSDAKAQSIAKKVDVDARVTYQGVVRANRTQLQALVFLNQWISKGIGKDRRMTLTPYRLLVTMVHTNTGWLIDNIDAK
ncbi:hypothetical protein [Nocardioides montaniterrae]